MGEGAFYFLVPVPVEEDRAIDILAKRWGVLTTPGRWVECSLEISAPPLPWTTGTSSTLYPCKDLSLTSSTIATRVGESFLFY